MSSACGRDNAVITRSVWPRSSIEDSFLVLSLQWAPTLNVMDGKVDRTADNLQSYTTKLSINLHFTLRSTKKQE